jgi:hypothetical protein
LQHTCNRNAQRKQFHGREKDALQIGTVATNPLCEARKKRISPLTCRANNNTNTHKQPKSQSTNLQSTQYESPSRST